MHELGYAKVGAKWGVALRSRDGNHNFQDENYEQWLFNEAPRALRMEAIDKLPELLDA